MGHDGPYSAPITTPAREVPKDWIDYNGHMNVAYYAMAFDQSVDVLMDDHLGLGEAHAERAQQGPYVLQSHMHYLGELLAGDRFEVTILLVDCDTKRMHLMMEMRQAESRVISATCEQILINVDLTARRAAPYPEWTQSRLNRMLSDHANAPRPVQMGQPLRIVRKG